MLNTWNGAWNGAPNAGPPLTVALAIVSVVVLAAWRLGALTRSGALAAATVGVAALCAGWSWGAFLLLWFVFASGISRVGRRARDARLHGVVAKGARRDAAQVFANGGVFTLAALAAFPAVAAVASPLHALGVNAAAIAGAAALAGAGADTWATEIGTLGRGRPWSLRERRRVAPGTSGAISLLGSGASVAAALLLASLAVAVGMIPVDALAPVALGGLVGAVADTIIGAWAQARRWCPACHMATEQPVHPCGTATVPSGGIGAIDNDVVNAACTVVAALTAVGTVWLLR